MTRIFIDCSYIDFSLQPTGIPRVVLKYIEEGYLWAEQSGHEVIPVVPTESGWWLCRPVPGAIPPAWLVNIERAAERWERAADRLRVKGRTSSAPHLFKPVEGDIVFSPAYWHDVDPKIYAELRSAGCRLAILVHDILPISMAHFYNSPWRYSFSAAVLHAVSLADQLFCVSNVTKLELEAFSSRRGRETPPISVAHNGFQALVSDRIAKRIEDHKVGPHLSDSRFVDLVVGDPPLLMVGSIEPKKGHIPVIKCL